MTDSARSTGFAAEIIACIREGREPSVRELFQVAEHIQRDIQGAASAFSWGGRTDDSSERLLSLRVAQAALTGNR